MPIDTMHKLFLDELQDVHSAEQQMMKALPKLAQNAASAELQQALQRHLELSREHVQRLEQILGQMEASPQRKKCNGMAGLIAEGDEVLKQDMQPEVKDAALIASAQRLEHYEIATYGTLRAFAEQMGATEAARLLERTLEEEKEADRALTQIAESSVNRRASGLAGQIREVQS